MLLWTGATHLEEKDAVPHKNVVALETLLLVVDAHIISWVGSSARFEKTMQDIQQWPPAETLKKAKSFRCIYKMVGAEGKVDWACYLGAQAVFDDQPDVIQRLWNGVWKDTPSKPGARTTRAHPSGPLLMQWSSTSRTGHLEKGGPWWPLKKGLVPEAQPNP